MHDEIDIENIEDELKKIIDQMGTNELLPSIKEKARNVDFILHRQFEDAILDAARAAAPGDKRNILYEALASLASVWNEHKPKKKLIQSFRDFFATHNYEESRRIYGELQQQGLDYLGDTLIKPGKLLPCFYEENPGLLLFSDDHDISILSSSLDTIKKIISFKDAKILDILPPADEGEQVAGANVNKKLWVLIQEHDDEKSIAGIDMANNAVTEPILQIQKIPGAAIRLSRFQDRLLLICPNSIYYYSHDGECHEWLSSRTDILCSAKVKDYYWILHVDGEVYLLKSIERVGLRKMKKFAPGVIPHVDYSERFAAFAHANFLNICDFESDINQAVKVESKIVQFLVLNNLIIVTLLANGNIAGIDVNQGQIMWQINLGNHYDSILRSGNNIYCVRKDGYVMIFKIPDFTRLADSLEKKNIQVPERPIEPYPTDPVRYVTDFIGRKEIIKEIREAGKLHFLVFGEPKIGKTSLLKVLPHFLSENSTACYVDIDLLLTSVKDYEDYEARFIEMCLSQHLLNLSILENIHGYQPYREMVDKIRGEKNFFLLCLDNFIIPSTDKFKNECIEKFNTFIKEMFAHNNVRMVITARVKFREDIENYLENLRLDTYKHGYQKRITLPMLTEEEVKHALRLKLSLTQEDVEKIYSYTGGFPHLIHLYDKWKKEEKTIELFTKEVAQTYWDKIFQYFKDLSRDAYLLIAFFLNRNLISTTIGFKNFYESYPLLKKLLPMDSLLRALNEINNYGQSFTTNHNEDSFSINMMSKANLFLEASINIEWLNVFLTTGKFSSAPNAKNAAEIAAVFCKMIKITLRDNSMDEIDQFKETFYTRQLTREGRQILGMPLTTFLVIPLKPWDKERVRQDFNSLYILIQEFIHKSRESMHEETLSLKFYILLFELHGTDFDIIKKGVKGLERVSVIDSKKMVDILLDKHPQEKSSEYIFSQLNISERSPYTTSGAVPDELFFGRELEIALIRGLSENIGIFGTRTIGKTSMLLKINRDINVQKRWKAFALDCSRIDSQESLLKNLAEKMHVAYEKISDLEKFSKYVTYEAAQKEIRYLFLLDEVDRLVQYDMQHDEKIFNTFNRLSIESLENGETAARFILFGFHQMFEQMKNPESRLYNFMVFLPLKPLDEKNALALVTQPMEHIRVKWQNEDLDAGYLVEKCSGHPLLLQAACQSLLAILDGKTLNKDIIERRDVENALVSDQFQQICMRFYPTAPRTNEAFLHDIHRIAILAAIRLKFENQKETFTFTDIYNKLKSYKLDISPDIMRNILDNLRLSGVFRFMNEATLLTRENTIIKREAEQKIKDLLTKDNLTGILNIEKLFENELCGKKLSEFTYTFAIKIFPELLMINLGGPERCHEELQRLVKKGNWKEWLRRQ